MKTCCRITKVFAQPFDSNPGVLKAHISLLNILKRHRMKYLAQFYRFIINFDSPCQLLLKLNLVWVETGNLSTCSD